MSATYYENEDVKVCISDRAMCLWRAENDNQIMHNLRRTPTLHAVCVVIGGIGVVGCFVWLFVEACVRNS